MISTINLESINSLQSLMGDKFGLLIQTFIRDSEGRIKTFDAAIKVPDMDGLARAAHSLKGSASNLGATQLSDLCAQLEAQAKEKDPDMSEITTLCAQVSNAYGSVKTQLQAYII